MSDAKRGAAGQVLGSDPGTWRFGTRLGVWHQDAYDREVASMYRLTPLRRIGNVLVAPLARLGLAGKRTHLLTVVGRKTGRRYSTPVQLVFQDGQRWLVAPYGERAWVRNARAAGWVELTRALRTERVRIEEVDAHIAAPILREYVRKTPITKPYFDANVGSPLEEFTAEALRHPVFRITVRIDA